MNRPSKVGHLGGEDLGVAGRAQDMIESFTMKPLAVQAIQLTTGNISAVAYWIIKEGGGVAGINWRDCGDIASRGITLGTLSGFEEISVGDWVVEFAQGDFRRMNPATFATMFDRTEQPGVPLYPLIRDSFYAHVDIV